MTLPTSRRGNYILWGTFVLCLLPFLLLSFVNLMTTDDYLYYKSCQERGVFQTGLLFFNRWSGRYTAAFMSAIFMGLGLPKYYFLHTWLMLTGTYSALFFLLSTVNTLILKQQYNRRLVAIAAAVLLLLVVYVQADIAGGFYWFSAAITYQLALILFLLLAGSLILRFHVPSGASGFGYDAVVCPLILLLAGCNEIMAVYQTAMLAMLLVGHYLHTRSIDRRWLAYLVTAIAADLFIVTCSGLFTFRYKSMSPSSGYINIFPIIFFRTFSVYYFILKVPLFWIAAFILYLAGGKAAASSGMTSALAAFKERRIFLPGFLLVSGLMILALTAIIVVTRGPLPERALNNLIDLTALGLLALVFVVGAAQDPRKGAAWSDMLTAIHARVLVVLLVSTMIAADAFVDGCSSCFTGYFYAAAQKTREKQIWAAAQSHQKTIVLEPFEESLQREVQRIFPHGTFETVHQWLQTKPALLYFAQDTENADRGYALFCGIDSVNDERTNGKDGKK